LAVGCGQSKPRKSQNLLNHVHSPRPSPRASASASVVSVLTIYTEPDGCAARLRGCQGPRNVRGSCRSFGECIGAWSVRAWERHHAPPAKAMTLILGTARRREVVA
jgi:hypothetical protein